MRQGIEGTSHEKIAAACALDYQESDFASQLLAEQSDNDLWLLSFWTDAAYATYRHKSSGLRVPFSIRDYNIRDARVLGDGRALHAEQKIHAQAIKILREEYEFEGRVSEEEFKQTLHSVFELAKPTTRIVVVTGNEFILRGGIWPDILDHVKTINSWTAEVAKKFANVTLINIRDCIKSEKEVHTEFHFDRMVYVRLAKQIEAICKGKNLKESWAIHNADDPFAICKQSRDSITAVRTAKFLTANKRYLESLSITALARDDKQQCLPADCVYLEGLAGLLEEASQHISRVRVAFHGTSLDAGVKHRIACSLLGLRLYSEAEQMFLELRSAEPAVFHHRHRLADVYEQTNRVAEAVNELEKCVAAGDDNIHVARKIVALKKVI